MLEIKMLYLDKHIPLALERGDIILLDYTKYKGLGKSTIIEKYINKDEKTLVISDIKDNPIYKSSDIVTFDEICNDKSLLKVYDKVYVEMTIYSLETQILLKEILHETIPNTYVAGVISCDI
jgi:hypothetical protein